MKRVERFVAFLLQTSSHFKYFILPEKESVSLKLIFDNVRNYFICVPIVSAGYWLKTTPAVGASPSLAYVLLAIGGILVFLNMAQSIGIFFRVLSPDTLNKVRWWVLIPNEPLRYVLVIPLYLAALILPGILAMALFALFVTVLRQMGVHL